jgi:hypothetical protein
VAWGLLSAAPVFFLGMTLLLRNEAARWLAVAAFTVRGLAPPVIYAVTAMSGAAPRSGPPGEGFGVMVGTTFHLLLAFALAFVPLRVLRGGRP